MPSPIVPSTFCAAVPNANADLCTRFSRFLSIASYLCDFFTWFLKGDGSFSTAVINEISAQLLPAGIMIHSATTSMGAGWLLCDASEVSRTTYATLFSVIGTRYGVGNGTTTFTLPDGRSRSLITAGQGVGLTFRDINTKTCGEEAHTMLSNELVSHTHTSVAQKSGGAVGPYTLLAVRDSAGAVTLTSDATGGAPPTAFNVIHPCLISYLFIKI